MRRCPLDRDEEAEEEGDGEKRRSDGFSFGHFSNVWYYLSTLTVPEGTTSLPRASFSMDYSVYQEGSMAHSVAVM